MRNIYIKLFLLLVCIAITFQTQAQAPAQTCTGSLGDPIISQDFGAGPNPGKILPSATTNMLFTTGCPGDGEYTISNSLVGAVNCHPETWQQVPSDHTGNPNGYMMIINASLLPKFFFTQEGPGLCPNTTYEFSAYVLNLIIKSVDSNSFIKPNIVFTIRSSAGKLLAADTTGDIPFNAYRDLDWKKYGVYFTTPADVTDVVVVMSNLAPGGPGNDLILDDITFRACGPQIQEGFGSFNGLQEQALCEGNSASYVLKAQVIGDNAPVYQWQSNLNNTGWTDIPGSTTDSIMVPFNKAVPGKYQYRLGVANGSSITDAGCRVYSAPLTVDVNPLPVIPPFAPQTVCQGYPLVLTATGGASYLWTGPNMQPTTQNPLIINNATPANAGTYYVQAMSAANCPGAAPVPAVVKVVPKVAAVLTNIDTAICAGETVKLNASGGLFYKWTPSTGLSNDTIPNPVAQPMQTTKYMVSVSNGGCSDSSRSVTITVNQNPVASAGGNKIIFEGQSVKLNGTVKGDNITGYSWSPASYLDDPTSLTPVTSSPDNITYTLTAESKSCGISRSSVFVRVYKKITIPNAFSPNNDGINDYWDIKELFTYPTSSLLVFNRYGQQVFQSVGYARPWDGSNNGSPLPPGTYYYILDLKNNTPKLSGWVLLLR